MKYINFGLLLSILFLAVITFFFGMWYGETKYQLYVNSTEKLLDKIYQEDSSFLDTIGETDEYVDYVESAKLIQK